MEQYLVQQTSNLINNGLIVKEQARSMALQFYSVTSVMPNTQLLPLSTTPTKMARLLILLLFQQHYRYPTLFTRNTFGCTKITVNTILLKMEEQQQPQHKGGSSPHNFVEYQFNGPTFCDYCQVCFYCFFDIDRKLGIYLGTY